MKNVFIALITLLSVTTSFGQQSITKTIQKFTELKVYDRIHVTLIKSRENKLVISGNDKDQVVFIENNGLLKIKMKLDEFLSGNNISIDLHYTETLTLIDVNENANLTTNDIIKGSKIVVKAQEAALISLKLDMDYVTVKSTTGSEIHITGKTTSQEVQVNTGGKVYNKALITKESAVTVLAGGYADIYGIEKVIAKVKAGGTINVHGNPKTFDKDDTFGGKIKLLVD